ncbi:glycosyltransferase [Flavobacterium sp. RSP15]|uniref:glycosyltransferase n=1 Tax=Flavobacterium sp. RSP15 TaxID=2497485 RepID=UPI000F849E22|nr:glycosyltransferase [Flavobacterium sp. RSP15]RTY86010.1 glycosyltransferase [Flavobacterium sp. RSP15]
MILIDALYINNSGGKVLLYYLVEEFEKSSLNVFYLFDKRCENDFKDIPANRKLYLKASFLNRLKFYIKNKEEFEKIFCFGNIAPPVKLNRAIVFTYFHNVSLLVQPRNYSYKEKIIKKIKKCLIQVLSKNTNFYVVQTLTVQKLVSKELNVKIQKVLKHPFFKEDNYKNTIIKDKNSFVYVSNGNTHKNHLKLFKAWEILAEREYYPVLNVTITSDFQCLIDKINILKNKKIKIINHGFCNPEKLYNKSKFLIYPSLLESLGLGLIEACQANCFVLAADLPYVTDVIIPTMVFDPYNSDSIADSIIEISKNENLKKSELKISNEIDEIIKLLK